MGQTPEHVTVGNLNRVLQLCPERIQRALSFQISQKKKLQLLIHPSIFQLLLLIEIIEGPEVYPRQHRALVFATP